MHLVNKIFIWLIFLAILPCFYFSARTLKTHAVWRSLGNSLEKELKQVKDEIYTIRVGKGDIQDPQSIPPIDLLATRLSRMQALRGHLTWFNVEVSVSNIGEATVTIPRATDKLLPEGTRIYAFEAQDEHRKGKYLGIFTVKSVDNEEVTMQPEPVRFRNPEVANAIKSSDGIWNLYTVMPRDEHEVFNVMDPARREDVLSELLPPAVLEEYLNDGNADKSGGGIFIRNLIDYEIAFELNMNEEMLLNDMLLIERDDQLTASENQKLAEQFLALRQQENQKLTEQQSMFRNESDVIATTNNQLNVALAGQKSRQEFYLKKIKEDALRVVKRDNEAYSRAPRAESQR